MKEWYIFSFSLVIIVFQVEKSDSKLNKNAYILNYSDNHLDYIGTG